MPLATGRLLDADPVGNLGVRQAFLISQADDELVGISHGSHDIGHSLESPLPTRIGLIVGIEGSRVLVEHVGA